MRNNKLTVQTGENPESGSILHVEAAEAEKGMVQFTPPRTPHS